MADLVRNHLLDKRWREVILMVASLLPNATAMFAEMRRVMDEMVADDAGLVAMLDWVESKTIAATVPDERRPAVRLAYICCALVLALALTLSLSRDRDRLRIRSRSSTLDCVRTLAEEFNLDRASSLARDLDLDRALALALASAYDLDGALAHTHALVRALVLDCALALARNLIYVFSLPIGVDYGLYYAWSMASILSFVSDRDDFQSALAEYRMSWPDLLHLCAELDNIALQQALLALSVSAGADRIQWQRYATHLLTVMRTHRDLGHKWEFSREQWDKLNDWLAAHEVPVQCLKLAVVPPAVRQEIEAGLLRVAVNE